MKILVISNNYPSKVSPTYGTFVYNLIQQFAKLGHDITVISASSAWKRNKFKDSNSGYGEELARIYRPAAISVSNKWIFGYNTHHIGEKFHVRAVKRVVEDNNIEFDVVYAHFLVNGIVAVKALSHYNKPIIVAEGELKNINLRKAYYRPKQYADLIAKINGIVAVSPQIKDNLIEVGVDANKIIISPNAVDLNRFYQRDKVKMREKYGLPLDKKLVIFVGRFVEDKGPLRVLNAVNRLDDVKIIFVGSGNQELEGQNIVFKNKVKTEYVPELLSAADLFVLPTLHEGSCNAIVEAMACGLPIISSDIPEIQFQCDPSFSILVDPMNIDAIEKAVHHVFTDEELNISMGENSLITAKKFNITERAKTILSFLENSIK